MTLLKHLAKPEMPNEVVPLENKIVAIAGSRNFNDYELLQQVLEEVMQTFSIKKLISGGAKGADELAEQYAANHQIDFEEVLPNWTIHGRGAGHRRNEIIVQKCDVLLAFWDGKSNGTKHIIHYAKKKNKEVIVYDSTKKCFRKTETLL